MTAVAERPRTLPSPSPGYELRWNAEDGQVHLYPRAELANLRFEYLVPCCSSEPLYPTRHARVEIGDSPVRHTTMCDRCAACDVADRRARRARR